MIKPPSHYQAPDQDQARFNRETVDSLAAVVASAGVDYDIQSLTVGITPTRVPHKLGRRWRGWVIVDRTTNASFRRVDPPAGVDPAFDLWLQATLASAVKVLIF